MLNRVEIRRLTWPLQNVPLCLPSKSPGLLLLYVLGRRSFVLWSAPNQLCCIWLNLGRECIPIHFRILPLLLSSVTSSLNTSNPVPLEAMHALVITLLHHVSQMMLYALDYQLFQAFSVLLSLVKFWYKLILISAIQRMLFQKWSGFFKIFLAKSNLALLAPCGEPSVFALMKSSLDCRLWQWHTSRECSSLGWMLWNDFSLPWRGPSDHPPLLSSVDVHAFYVVELTSAFFFPQNAPKCWFDTNCCKSECSCYLSNAFVLFFKPNNCLFHLCAL